MATSFKQFVGLTTEGDQTKVPVWTYYEQITMKNGIHHYIRFQDAFYGSYVCSFIKTLKKRRVLEVTWKKFNYY